jgi:tripartite-type tricarboxylate transporter receptor subunit TctC
MLATKMLGILVALAEIATTSATAQDWPTRPITMVAPYAAGGPVDVIGRILAQGMSETLGRQVIVENVGGAGGITGAQRVARAPADGYQFLLGASGVLAQNQTLYKHAPYNAATDFAPVGLIAVAPPILPMRKDLAENNLKKFIAYAKANQNTMRLNKAMSDVLDSPAVRDRLTELGNAIVPPPQRTPEYLAMFIRSEIEKWAGPIRASGISMD